MKDTQLINPQNQSTVIAALSLLQELIEAEGQSSLMSGKLKAFADQGWNCPTSDEVNQLIDDINVDHHFNRMSQLPEKPENERSINVLVLLEFKHESIPASVLEARFDGCNFYRVDELLKDDEACSLKGWQYLPNTPSPEAVSLL